MSETPKFVKEKYVANPSICQKEGYAEGPKYIKEGKFLRA